MSTVISRSTGQILKSVHTPDYPDKDWIINPVLPDCESKYMEISGETVNEMNASEKSTVDQAAAKATTDAQAERDRDALILERALKNAEDELIAEEVIGAKVG